jgi:hypothetical protein
MVRRRATICHLLESCWDCPAVGSAGTDIRLDSLSNAIVGGAAISETSGPRFQAGDGNTDLEEDRFNRGDSTPAVVSEKLMQVS